MEKLKNAESNMHQDMDNYVKIVDDFETALNKRTTAWHDRAMKARKMAGVRKQTVNLVISALIALGAIAAAAAVLFK